MPRIAVLDCDGEPLPGDPASDDGGLMGANIIQWLRGGAEGGGGGASWQWVHLRPKTRPDELPQSAGEYDGYVIPGSRAMVTDRAPWMAAVTALVRDAHARGLPLVGICFGHQLIGDALGGKVVYKEVGGSAFNCAVDEVVLEQPAAGARMFPGDGSLRLMKGHSQQLVELPPGAELLE